MSDSTLNEFQAFVEVDGRPLPEYDPQFDIDSNTWTCWIPSEVGKNFVIHWRNFGERATTGAYVYVDGEFADGKLLFESNTSQQTSVSGKRSSAARVAPFTFQNIALTDDDSIPLEDERKLNDIGQIKVVINKGTYGGSVRYRYEGTREPKPVHEQSKKVGGHRVQYANKTKDRDSQGAAFQVDPSVKPVTFIFQYRPKDMLQAMGILDRGQAAQHPGGAPVKSEPGDIKPPRNSRRRNAAAIKREDPAERRGLDVSSFVIDSAPSTSRGVKRENEDVANSVSSSGSRPRQRIKRETE